LMLPQLRFLKAIKNIYIPSEKVGELLEEK
jgi:hypothetical protein